MLQRQVYQGAYQSGGVPATVPPRVNRRSATSFRSAKSRTRCAPSPARSRSCNYNLEQLKSRIDKMENDVEQRFTQLEHGAAPAGAGAARPPLAAAAPPPPSAADAARPPPAVPGAGHAERARRSVRPAAAPAAGGRACRCRRRNPAERHAAGAIQLPPSGCCAAPTTPPPQRRSAPSSQRYPNDPLAGNAQYWLGETYYVRKDYKNAAAAFAEGYQKYPKGPKAADDLLKLGMSLGNARPEGRCLQGLCAARSRLPDRPGQCQGTGTSQKQAFGC